MFSGRTAAEAVAHNKLRAGLTSLGILFGVASVIAMLALGKGAEQEILEQMKLLGANNIVITPIVEQKEGKVDSDPTAKKAAKRFTPGLSYLDAEAIQRTIQLAFLGQLAHMAVAHGEPLYMSEAELKTFSSDPAFPARPWEYYMSRIRERQPGR